MSHSVPFFSLTQQWARIKPNVMPKIENLLDAQMCIGGAAVETFEKEFAAYTGAQHAIGCSSGTSALWLALRALDLQPNSIVLTTPFSFIASASEIYEHAAHPVFIDIDERSFNLSAEKMTAWLEAHTIQKDGRTIETKTGYPVAGIIAVNLFGCAADASALMEIKKKYNLWLIEDAAQSIGASDHGNPSGTLGDISCFSFYPTKNLSAAGDAGALTTQSDTLAERLRQLRNHGRSSHYNYQGYGTNARLDAIQAIVLSEKLAILPDLLEQRRSIAARYTKAFSQLPGITCPQDDGNHTYHQYTLTIDEKRAGCSRDTLMQRMTTAGVGTRVYYPELLNQIEYLQTDSRLYTQTPTAQQTVQQVLSLPIWPELSAQSVAAVIEALTTSLQATPLTKKNHTQGTTL